MLKYDEPPGLKVADYLADCRKWLKDDEWEILSSAVLVPQTEEGIFFGVVDEFRLWEISLRNELVMHRAAAMGLEADNFIVKSESFADTASLAAHAFKQESPMDAEEVLNQGRWQFLENLKAGHFFDLEYLILYSLQLQIFGKEKLL